MKLEGKVAVVTGGNSGIGLATAREFRNQGAKVAIFGRDQSTLARAAGEIGAGTLAERGSVTNTADLDRLFERVAAELGKIDVLMVSAGIAKFAPVSEFTEALFDEVCDINFKGAFFTVQKAICFLNDGASVILVATAGNSTRGNPLTSVYTATKAAVRSLARTLSAELIQRGIRVNALSPGMTATPILTRDVGLSNELRTEIADRITSRIPAGRRGDPEDMARAALFLASSDSAYCVGSEFVVDGGLMEI